MAKIHKQVLSQYLRTNCDRYLFNALNKKNPKENHLIHLSGRPGVAAFRV